MVGNPGTLESVKQMEEKKLVTQIGVKEGHPIYRVTETGAFFIEYSMKKLGETNKEKAKSFLKSLGKAMDNYIQDYKAENPVGMEDVRRAFGWFEPDRGITLPPIEPLTLREQKKLPKPNKDERDYVIVDGVKYYREV